MSGAARPPADTAGGGDPYELLDLGAGRRLERFGDVIVDRPAPGAAEAVPEDPAAWSAAAGRFVRTGGSGGRWEPAGDLPQRWTVAVEGVRLELRPTPAGQVGLFPEHLPVARWAAEQASAVTARRGRPAVVLNLFAYTGLATLVLARAGAAVTHVDASRPAVAWARRNAELAGLADRSIRWLVDDAGAFVAREARRGRRYDGVLLDPPSYGHGPRGRAWRLADDLPILLAGVRDVLEPDGWFVGCTAHATGLAGDDLAAAVRAGLAPLPARVTMRPLRLEGRGGLHLPAGWAALAAASRGGVQ